MKIDEILKMKRTLSFEVFPPKKEKEDLPQLFETLKELKQFNPDFISVTYGAGGSNRKSNAEIAGFIKSIGIEPLAHITGGPSTKKEIDEIILNLKKYNVENVFALRGDKPVTYEGEYCKEFRHATDLIDYLKDENFSIGAACYPEGHQECNSLYEDLVHLKEKQDLGAKFFVTQIFYDNEYYYRLIAEARNIGITIPIIPGVMPITSIPNIDRIKTLCGATIPLDFRNMLEKYRNNPKVLREIGINYAVYQITDLIAKGAPGIHLYIMNKFNIAKDIYERLTNTINELF